MKINCDVYKSLTRKNLYLYVEQGKAFERVPEELVTKFGKHELALSFELTADRRLAKEDARLVLKNLAENGFHLQLPPVE